MKKRVADIIIDTLVENGITDCFLVVGGGAMHLDNALAKNDKINKICNHHEQACAMAAEAYARVSGRIAAVCVTSGPGATNAVTGVMGAWQDSIPMIVLSGQVRYEISSMKTELPLRYRGIQEYNIVPAVRNMTKYANMIIDPLSVKCEVEKAIDIAMSGRRGPVWLDIPLDIQSAIVDTDDLYVNNYSSEEKYVTEEEIQKLVGLIKTSDRPCILGGTGIVSAHLQNEFIDFVEKMNIPVIGGGWCTDMMYTDHPLYYGLSGDIGPRTGNFIVQNADLILVLGNSLSYRQTGYAQDFFAPNAKIVWVDVDKYEALKPGMHPYLFINSDLKHFFKQIQTLDLDLPEYTEWFRYCDMLKSRFTPFESIENEKIKGDARVNSYYFWKVFDKYALEDSVIAMGNSRGNAAKIQIGVKRRGQRAITNYLCGSMGYDLPAAVGSAIATKGEVMCITGDGSIMMNLQELQTIKQYNLPIKVAVFSNEGYEAIRQTCKNFFGGVYLGCTKESGVSFPDFEKVAKAFDFSYDVCENNNQLDEKLNNFFAYKGNIFLEIKQQIENPLIPKVMSRMRDDGTFETPALHDMAPFLPKEELRKLMIGE